MRGRKPAKKTHGRAACCGREWLPLWFGLMLLTGCSTLTTVHTKNGTTVRGTIDRADDQSVVLVTEDGQEASVDRASIEDVEHPGETLAVVGGVAMGFGAAGLTLALVELIPPCPDDSEEDYRGDCELGKKFQAAFFLPGPIGALIAGSVLLGVGLDRYLDSVERLEAGTVEPTAFIDPSTNNWRLGLRLHW